MLLQLLMFRWQSSCLVACHALIAAIRSIPIWVVAVAWRALAAGAWRPQHYLLCAWALGEVAWIPYYSMLRRGVRSRPARGGSSCRSPEDRRALAERCVDAMCALGCSKKTFLERWFLGADPSSVTRRDFERWVAWSFFDSEPTAMSERDLSELRSLVDWFEARVDHAFPRSPGDGTLPCIRLKYDPVRDARRPLTYYAATSALYGAGRAVVFALGFRRDAADPRIFYRPAAAPRRTSTATPVVFMHGIGIGFVHYALLLASLPRDRAVLLVDDAHVSQCLATAPPPSPEEAAAAVDRALRRHGHLDGAVFLAHSLGTTSVAWCLKMKHIVRSCVLIDPLTFLLVAPTTAYNFLHRRPRSPIQLLLDFFIARELFTANAIQRHFSWTHNTLFVDDLPKRRSTVVLSQKDLITDAPLIKHYLEPARARGDVDVHFHAGLEHGELFLRPALVARTLAALRAHCALEDEARRTD